MPIHEDASAKVARLIEGLPFAELGPGAPREAERAALGALRPTDMVSGPLRDERMAKCCLAGLWLAYDFLDESHRLSQEIETPEGSYWHGIMHRREPDYANSKYWFRRVGRHAIEPELRAQAGQHFTEWRASATSTAIQAAAFLSSQQRWHAESFVDLCEAAGSPRAASEPSSLNALCRRIALAEWRLLFEYCRSRA